MVSDKTIHKAFRIHKTLTPKPIRAYIFLIIYQNYTLALRVSNLGYNDFMSYQRDCNENKVPKNKQLLVHFQKNLVHLIGCMGLGILKKKLLLFQLSTTKAKWASNQGNNVFMSYQRNCNKNKNCAIKTNKQASRLIGESN